MTATVWLDAVKALASAWSALPGYRRAGTTTQAAVTVFVGGEVDDENIPGRDGDYVVVGDPGDPGRPAPAGSFGQRPGPMAASHPRDEQARIRVRLVSQPGTAGGGVLAAAEAVEGYLRDIEGLLTADPTLGIAAPTAARFLAQLDSAGAWWLQQTDGGPLARVDGVVTYTARLV